VAQDPTHGRMVEVGAEHGREALRLRADPLLDQLAPLSQDTDLTFLLVEVDANMVHGWPLLSAALTASVPCGAAYTTTSAGGQPLHPIYALRMMPAFRLGSGRLTRGLDGWPHREGDLTYDTSQSPVT
jgi:hypothetical protein